MRLPPSNLTPPKNILTDPLQNNNKTILTINNLGASFNQSLVHYSLSCNDPSSWASRWAESQFLLKDKNPKNILKGIKILQEIAQHERSQTSMGNLTPSNSANYRLALHYSAKNRDASKAPFYFYCAILLGIDGSKACLEKLLQSPNMNARGKARHFINQLTNDSEKKRVPKTLPPLKDTKIVQRKAKKTPFSTQEKEDQYKLSKKPEKFYEMIKAPFSSGDLYLKRMADIRPTSHLSCRTAP